ncbi:hypothetical protein GCM10010469_12620 [Streptomyces labedae]|uniref:Uncharacterized protein n=1 Tax=Streptomyces labedae TaxID=285569 RepID=A0ABP6QT22_9ACTN
MAPVTTTPSPAALLTFRSLRPHCSAERSGYPAHGSAHAGRGRTGAKKSGDTEWSPGRDGGITAGAAIRWVRMAVASRRMAPQGFSRTIVPVGEW